MFARALVAIAAAKRKEIEDRASCPCAANHSVGGSRNLTCFVLLLRLNRPLSLLMLTLMLLLLLLLLLLLRYILPLPLLLTQPQLPRLGDGARAFPRARCLLQQQSPLLRVAPARAHGLDDAEPTRREREPCCTRRLHRGLERGRVDVVGRLLHHRDEPSAAARPADGAQEGRRGGGRLQCRQG